MRDVRVAWKSALYQLASIITVKVLFISTSSCRCVILLTRFRKILYVKNINFYIRTNFSHIIKIIFFKYRLSYFFVCYVRNKRLFF